jgi:hypothetical protein
MCRGHITTVQQRGGTVSDSGLSERIEKQKQVITGGNHALFVYNCAEVQNLLTKLDFDDLLHEEVITIHYVLAEAYGRKLAGGPSTLRLVPEGADGAEYLCC